MIDLHSHVLPGLDDGAATIDEALEMLRSMAEDGVRVVAATPHVRDDYPTTSEQMHAALADVRAAVGEAGIPVDVRAGAEIALPMLDRLPSDEIARLGLGGNQRLLLLEYPYYGQPHSLARECERLRSAGIVPVVAHPERNELVQDRPADLAGIVACGGLMQLTAASVDGRLGGRAAACASRLLELGLAHLIASDAHSAGRAAGLTRALRVVGDVDLGEWLTSSVPAALLDGVELPVRPPWRKRRSFVVRLRRGR